MGAVVIYDVKDLPAKSSVTTEEFENACEEIFLSYVKPVPEQIPTFLVGHLDSSSESKARKWNDDINAIGENLEIEATLAKKGEIVDKFLDLVKDLIKSRDDDSSAPVYCSSSSSEDFLRLAKATSPSSRSAMPKRRVSPPKRKPLKKTTRKKVSKTKKRQQKKRQPESSESDSEEGELLQQPWFIMSMILTIISYWCFTWYQRSRSSFWSW